jgi:hypothetical protein
LEGGNTCDAKIPRQREGRLPDYKKDNGGCNNFSAPLAQIPAVRPQLARPGLMGGNRLVKCHIYAASEMDVESNAETLLLFPAAALLVGATNSVKWTLC